MTDKKISELPAITSINSANELPIVDTGVSKKVSITQLLEFIAPDATTAIKGKVELATDAETQIGTDAVRAVTPAGMASVVSSETLRGLIEIATSAEIITGTDAVRAVTPAGLAAKVASVTAQGIVELATDAETIAGTDAVRAVTPAGLAATKAPGCRLTKSAVQLLANNTWTVITWDQEVHDTSSMHDNSTNPSRITIPKAGVYLLTAVGFWDTNGIGARFFGISKNGTRFAECFTSAPGDSIARDSISVTCDAAINDYFEFLAYQGSGGNLNFVNTFAGEVISSFSAHYLGPT